MKFNLFMRIIIFIILTAFFYIIFKEKDIYRHYREKRLMHSLYKRIIIFILIALSLPTLYFIIPDNFNVVLKFYIIFALSILIAVGLILLPIIEKKRGRPLF